MEKKMMTMYNPEVLIRCVEKRPAVYNKAETEYNNKSFIRSCWEEIGEEVGCSGDEARKRWTHLRDYFRKNHTNLSSGSAASMTSYYGRAKKKWYLYDKMSWLAPFLKPFKEEDTSPGVSVEMEDDSDVDEEIKLKEEFQKDIESRSEAGSSPDHIKDEVLDDPLLVGDCEPGDDVCLPGPSDTGRGRQLEKYRMFELQASSEHQDCSEGAHKPLDKKPKIYTPATEVTGPVREYPDSSKVLPRKRAHPSRDNHQDGGDSNLLFFKSLAPYMRLLDTIERMECEAEIHMTVLRHIRRKAARDPSLNLSLTT